MKVIISEACDGFTIILTEDDNTSPKYYRFGQEDTKEELVDLFNNRMPKSISTTHTMQCEVCGKIKSYKVEH